MLSPAEWDHIKIASFVIIRLITFYLTQSDHIKRPLLYNFLSTTKQYLVKNWYAFYS